MATYYFAQAGSDAAPVNSQATPWKTAAKFATLPLMADDVILLNRGDVWNETFVFPAGGTSAAHRITLGAYGTGALPKVSGSDVQGAWTPETIVSGVNYVSDASLKGLWNLDNALTDSSSGGNTLSNTGVTFSTVDKQQGTHAAVFVAASTPLLSRADASLSSGFPFKNGSVNSAVTMGGWFKTGTLATGQHLWSKGTTEVYIDAGLDGFMKLTATVFLDGGYQTIRSDDSVFANTWYFIVVRVDSTTKKLELFINETPQFDAYTATSTALTGNASDFRIGYNGLAYFAGIVDEVWMFTRSLSNKEIEDIYRFQVSGSGGQTFVAYRSNDLSYPTDPKQAFENASRAQRYFDKTFMLPHGWYYDSVNARVYVRTTGDLDISGRTITVSARDYCVNGNAQNYICVQDLELVESKKSAVIASANSGLYQRLTITNPYFQGLEVATDGSVPGPFVSYCTISYCGAVGVNMLGGQTDGFLVDHNVVHHCSLISLETDHGSSAGIRVGAAALGSGVIEYNEVYLCGARTDAMPPFLGQNGTPYDGGNGIWVDTTAPTGSTIHVRYNLIHDNYRNGIIFEATTDCRAYYNRIWGHQSAAREMGYGILVTRLIDSAKVYNNVCYSNRVGGGVRGEGTPGSAVNIQFKNNLFFLNSLQLQAKGGGENDGTMGSGNVYLNNCLGAPVAGTFVEWGELVYKDSVAAFDTAYGSATSTVGADPRVDGNFRPTSKSPCINAGLNLGLTPDIAGTTVPQRTTTDIGAYEFIPLSECTATAETGTNTFDVLLTDAGADTPFDVVFTDTNSTIKYDTTHPHRGGLSFKTVGTSSPCAAYLGWTIAFGIRTDYYGRFYTYGSGWSTNPIMSVLFGGAQCMRLMVTATLAVQARNFADTILGTSTTLMTASAWNRVEFHVVHSATVGQVQVKLFVGANVDGKVADETLTYTNVNTLAAGDEFRVGVLSNTALTTWLDDIVAGSDMYPGPSMPSPVALTGVLASTALGTILRGVPLTGIGATSSLGSLALTRAAALVGVSGQGLTGVLLIPVGSVQTVVDSFRVALLNGLHAFGPSVVRGSTAADAFKAALYVTTATQNAATTVYSATGEVAGSGYSAGGISVPNANPPANTGSVAYWTPSATLAFNSVTLSTAFDAMLLYNSTSGAKLAVAVLTFGAQTVTAGNFTMSMPANTSATGLLRLT